MLYLGSLSNLLGGKMTSITLLLNLTLISLDVFTWLILINIVASWLLAFGVINYSNPIVHKVMRIVYGVTEPVMSPVRNALPSFGGLDLSPIVILFAIQGLKKASVTLFYSML